LVDERSEIRVEDESLRDAGATSDIADVDAVDNCGETWDGAGGNLLVRREEPVVVR
jgi:hypothetical protein